VAAEHALQLIGVRLGIDGSACAVLMAEDAMLSNSELAGVPLLVLANKMDLENAKSANHISAMLDLEGHQGTVASYPICALTRCVKRTVV
jgi:signal recognition particle receptor subunit beta